MDDMNHKGFPAELSAGLPLKLKKARDEAKLSTREVAQRLAGRHALSHATIGNYEKGRTVPNVEVLAALAEVYGKPLGWFLEWGPALVGVRYRNLKSKVRVSDRQSFEAAAQRWLVAYVKLERRLGDPLTRRAPELTASPSEGGKELARRVRVKLKFKDADSVPSVVQLLELFGVRVIELPTDLAIDAMAGRLGDQFVVVLNPKTANDRCRMNAAHELGHVLMGDCEGAKPCDDAAAEKRAFEFASHLLLPDGQMREAFKGQSMVRLVQFKERYGISLSAMIFRAEESGVITKAMAKHLWVEFAKRGWRTNEPGHVRPDRATRFEQLLDGAIAQEKLTWREAATMMGVHEEEARGRLAAAMGVVQPTELGNGGGRDGDVLPFPT